VLQATLAALQSADPAWEGLALADLRSLLGALWRTAGRWELTATHPVRSMAQAAAETWSAQVSEHTAQAVEQARRMLALDAQRQASARARSALIAQQATRQQVLSSLQSEMVALADEGGETLDERSRQRLLGLAGRAASFTPAWQAALANFPDSQAPAAAYPTWTAGVISLIETDLELGEGQLAALENDLLETESAYQAAVQQSFGLSPNLVVEGAAPQQPEVTVQRPTGELVALGAALGFLAWLLFAVIQINQGAGT
jgi:hypothetical protein